MQPRAAGTASRPAEIAVCERFPGADREESALPLRGKKKNLTRKLWIDYFCRERLGLSAAMVGDLINDLSAAVPRRRQLLSRCSLSEDKTAAYSQLLDERLARL